MGRFMSAALVAAFCLLCFGVVYATNCCEYVGWVTGPGLSSQFGIGETDLGVMFAANGRIYYAFGDTYSDGRYRPEQGTGGHDYRGNTFCWSTSGLAIDDCVTGHGGMARQVLHPWDGCRTATPTAGIAIEPLFILHYMCIISNDGHDFRGAGSGLAYSLDGGYSWHQAEAAGWADPNTPFGMAAFVIRDSYLYMFGTPLGRRGGVSLARAPLGDAIDVRAYTYWDGASWSLDIEDAVQIVPAPVGEMSVAYNDYLQRWLMLYMMPESVGIVLRTAPYMNGPWSEPETILPWVEGSTWGTYAPYLHPWASSGQYVEFNLSRWHEYQVQRVRLDLSP